MSLNVHAIARILIERLRLNHTTKIKYIKTGTKDDLIAILIENVDNGFTSNLCLIVKEDHVVVNIPGVIHSRMAIDELFKMEYVEEDETNRDVILSLMKLVKVKNGLNRLNTVLQTQHSVDEITDIEYYMTDDTLLVNGDESKPPLFTVTVGSEVEFDHEETLATYLADKLIDLRSLVEKIVYSIY